MKISAPPPFVLAGLVLVGSCVSNDSTGIGDSTSSAAVFVQPAVVPSAADASAMPINRIRTVTARHPDNVVLDDTVFTVDPQAVEWALDLSVSLVQSPVTAHVFIHLIHDDGAGAQETQYSGVTDTMTIARGEAVEADDMPLVRGPLANLFVTGVEITSLDTVVEGQTAELTAEVTSSVTSEPTVYWTSLDTTVLIVEGSTAFGVQPGLADVVATAGAVSDTATLEVIIPPVDSVLVSPDSADVAEGSTVTYVVELFGPTGATLTGRNVTWSTGDAGVATVDQAGLVTGVAVGTTTVTATSEGVTDDAIVTVSPATSHPLVFSSDRAGNGSLDIWTASADGSSTNQLTSTASTDQGARWSPDGSRILFTRDDGTNELIWVMDDDGSNATQLSGAQSDHSYAEWSPDGSQIVFTNFDGISEDIWVMNSDGTSPTAITTDRQLNELMPSVSPANTLIAFVTNASGSRDIWRMNRDGTSQTEITTDPGVDEDPSWHPDGTRIVFSSLRNNATDIYVIGVDGSGETQLTANAGRNHTPVFSPDGTQIYFTSDRTGNSEIWVMDADGTNQRQVTDSPFFDGGPDVRN